MHAAATVPGNNALIADGAPMTDNLTTGLISADGTTVAFNTRGVTTTDNPNNLKMGLISLNLASGQMNQVDVSTAGVQSNADQGGALPRAISETGRYIVFIASSATNLIDGATVTDEGGGNQLYLRDTLLGTTTLVSQSITGDVANHGARALGVSEDGRFVLFYSNSTNLSPDATNGYFHLYLLDRKDDTLTVLDRNSSGTVVSSNMAPIGAMSCDGSLVVFQTQAPLLPNEVGGPNLYLLDMRNGQRELMNITSMANAASGLPTISCNGNYIGFTSQASNLDPSVSITPNVPNGPLYARPYIYDRVNNTYHLIATTSPGVGTNTNECYGNISGSTTPCMVVSDIGVAIFQTQASSQLGYGGNQLVLHDINTDTTELLSKNSNGIAGDSTSNNYSITSNGSKVLFSSSASNLIVGRTINYNEIYLATTGL